MPRYRFTERFGAINERLGSVELADDASAIAFARTTVGDLLIEDAERYAAYAIEISQGERTVATVVGRDLFE